MGNKTGMFFFVLLLFISAQGYGEQAPYSIASTPHIKMLNYSKNDVHKYVGFYGQESSILFEGGEVIDTMSMGVSSGWQLEPKGNRLFIKPVGDNADTNATIITNKRIYHFKFYAQDAEGLDDPNIAYEVRFKYPSNNITINNNIIDDGMDSKKGSDASEISSASNLNFDYLVQGVDQIKPVIAYDDGDFTYLKFENKIVPSVFLVGSDGYESLVNYRMRGDYMIIERVEAKFTLRHGQDTVCLTNAKIPFYYKPTKNKSLFS